MAGRVTDCLFMNGNTNDGFNEIMSEARQSATASGRDPSELKFGCNGFTIIRDSMKEATEQLREIIVNADVEAVKGFGEAVKGAARETKDGKGMWGNSSFADLVQYNDGFKTGLIGTPETVAKRIIELKQLGMGVILAGSFTTTGNSKTLEKRLFLWFVRWRRIFVRGKGSEKRAPKVLPPEGRVPGTDGSAGALSNRLA